MSELLCREPLGGRAQELATTIHDSANILLDVLKDVLDMSLIESGRIRLESIAFDPRNVIDEVCRLFMAMARIKGIHINAEFSADLPPVIMGDPTRLRQVISNLVNNAVKFTSTGGVRVRAAVIDGQRMCIEVEDSGIGIARDRQARIFEPFTQGDESTSRHHGGTGLGLAIVRDLVTLMGGSIDLESDPGKGSVFRITLPIQKVSVPAAAQAMPPAIADPHAGPARRYPQRRVLLVEDDPVGSAVTSCNLVTRGIDVIHAEDGFAAIAAHDSSPFDLILMDVQMKNMDGFEATREIRDSETRRGSRHVPIVAITAHASAVFRERCMAAGMNDVLAKPFNDQELGAMLERWL